MDSITQDVKELIAEIIEKDVKELGDDAHFVEDLGVDSLLALEILASMEKKYKIEIPEEDLVKFTTVNHIVDIVKEKINRNQKN
jgi:acyl carrier protein